MKHFEIIKCLARSVTPRTKLIGDQQKAVDFLAIKVILIKFSQYLFLNLEVKAKNADVPFQRNTIQNSPPKNNNNKKM